MVTSSAGGVSRRAVVLSALAGPLAFTPARADSADIAIGGAIPLSGANASYGEDVKLGIELGLRDVNAKGGALGRKLAVTIADTQSDRSKAAALFRRFADDPSVVAILSYSTDEFLAVDPLATTLKVANVSVGSAGAIARIGPYSFRTMVIVDKVMDSVLGQLKSMYDVKTVAVIYEASNNYTVSEVEAVKRAAGKLGVTVAAVESFSRGDQNFSLQLTRIAAVHPDLFVVSAATDEAVPIITQSRSMGLSIPIFGGTSMNDPRIGKLAGPAAQGLLTYFPFDASDGRPPVQDLVAAFRARTGSETAPSGHTATSYDAVHLLADAIRRAGSTDREAIHKALGETKDLEGANGRYSYAGSGDNLNQAPYVFRFGPNGYARAAR